MVWEAIAAAAGEGLASGIGSGLASGVGSAVGNLFGGGGDKYRPVFNRPLKNRIRWSVRDAKRAGIHPLYAIGAPAVGAAQPVGDGGMQLSVQAGREAYQKARAQNAQDRIIDAQVQESEAKAEMYRSESAKNSFEIAVSASDLARQRQPAAVKKDYTHKVIYDYFTKKPYVIPNPDYFELPETIGGYEYGRGRLTPEKGRRIDRRPIAPSYWEGSDIAP